MLLFASRVAPSSAASEQLSEGLQIPSGRASHRGGHQWGTHPGEAARLAPVAQSHPRPHVADRRPDVTCLHRGTGPLRSNNQVFAPGTSSTTSYVWDNRRPRKCATKVMADPVRSGGSVSQVTNSMLRYQRGGVGRVFGEAGDHVDGSIGHDLAEHIDRATATPLSHATSGRRPCSSTHARSAVLAVPTSRRRCRWPAAPSSRQHAPPTSCCPRLPKSPTSWPLTVRLQRLRQCLIISCWDRLKPMQSNPGPMVRDRGELRGRHHAGAEAA